MSKDKIDIEGDFSGMYWRMYTALCGSPIDRERDLANSALTVWNNQFDNIKEK